LIWHTAAKNTGYEYQFLRFPSRDEPPEGLMLHEINAMSDYDFDFLQRVSL
jgi:hypothetical protein